MRIFLSLVIPIIIILGMAFVIYLADRFDDYCVGKGYPEGVMAIFFMVGVGIYSILVGMVYIELR